MHLLPGGLKCDADIACAAVDIGEAAADIAKAVSDCKQSNAVAY